MFGDWRKWCRLCSKPNGTDVDIFYKLETVSSLSVSVQKFFHISVSGFFFLNIFFVCRHFDIQLKKKLFEF